MMDEEPNGFLMAGCAVADHTGFERADDLERHPVLHDLLTEEHIRSQHLLGHEIPWPSHVALQPVAPTVARRDGAARGTQIYPDIKYVLRPLQCLLCCHSVLVDARLRYRSSCCRRRESSPATHVNMM